MEQIFGVTITNSEGKVIPSRFIGEQHVREDCGGIIPSVQDWLRGIPHKSCMTPPRQRIPLPECLSGYKSREEWRRGALEICREWTQEIPNLSRILVMRRGAIHPDRTISHPFVVRGEARILLETSGLRPLSHIWPICVGPDCRLERIFELRALEAMDAPVLMAARSPRQAMARALRHHLLANGTHAAAVVPFGRNGEVAEIITAEDLLETEDRLPELPERLDFFPA